MGKFRLKRLFIFIVSAVLVVAAVRIYTKKVYEKLSGTEESAEAVKENEASLLPEYENTGAEIKLSGPNEQQKILSFDMTGYADDGRKKWDIQGKSADIVSDVVVLNELQANTYSDDRTVALTAQTGEYDKKNNSVKLENNVVVTTSDGVNLTAEWFKWASQTEIIETESFVEVRKDNLYASGYGAFASTKNKEVRLNKDIVVKQDDMTINCAGPLEIDYNNNKASFYDKVKVTDPRGELLADRLDIFFNPDSRKIEKVVAERNVELRRGENVAKGQSIVYTVASGEAILTGNPEIVIYSKEEMKNALTGN